MSNGNSLEFEGSHVELPLFGTKTMFTIWAITL